MAEPSPRGVHAAALADLPGCGPAALARLLTDLTAPAVWSILRGDPSDAAFLGVPGEWHERALAVDLDALEHDLERHEVLVTTHHDSQHPDRLVGDIDPAPVIFRRGAPVRSRTASVAIVGTRRCSPTGRELAEALGYGLAREGVTVISGLALGVDGAAHRGALRAGGAAPIGVVGSGLDIVYPSGNADLWRRMGDEATLLSEAALGAPPEPWRFPARNRIIAALADLVLVVESRARGGSMITVEEAVRRGRTVLAVPGSVRNPVAAGTNLLISEGCPPVCGVEDVLVALGLVNAGPGPRLLTERGEAPGMEPEALAALDAVEIEVLEILGFDGSTIDSVAVGCGRSVGEVAAAIVALEQRSLVSILDGRVRRRVASGRPAGE